MTAPAESVNWRREPRASPKKDSQRSVVRIHLVEVDVAVDVFATAIGDGLQKVEVHDFPSCYAECFMDISQRCGQIQKTW